jgi:hypothetical protein
VTPAPNGLAAAIMLASAGRSVLVVEANASVGGGARSQNPMRVKAPADESRPATRGKGAARLKRLMRELSSVRADMLRLESEAEAWLRGLHTTYRDSAGNLLHYLALRRRDLRQAQYELAALGLSSLGRSESHVMQNLEVEK